MRKFKKIVQILVAIFLFIGMTNAQQKDSYELVYEVDRKGKVVSGSLEKLNEYVDKGYVIRVGWSMGRVRHWAEAMFITQHKGNVFAQIHSIFMQAPSSPSTEIPKIEMANKPHGWTAIIGTTGAMQMNWDVDILEAARKRYKTEEEYNKFLERFKKSKTGSKWVIIK
jgi:hypothetical protein